MSKRTLIIWLPAFLGVLLVIVTKVDLYQFSVQSIDVQTMLWREVPIVFSGLLLGLAVFLSSIYWLMKKKWRVAVQSIVSPFVFLILFTVAGAMGSAFLNAT